MEISSADASPIPGAQSSDSVEVVSSNTPNADKPVGRVYLAHSYRVAEVLLSRRRPCAPIEVPTSSRDSCNGPA